MTPKVSIVVPVYNVEKYLPACLGSIMRQSLRDIEIIVVNDGSTDESLLIAQKYAKEDDRVIIIDKENGGYGHSMNCGFRKARGEYIGIVESDDCARPEMFEKLYTQASSTDADVVRSNYYTMANNGTKFTLIDVLNLAHAPYNTAINPQEYPDILRGSPAIWTGLYKRDFIQKNNITFLESPGASYQDTGFMLKVLSAADKVVLMREAFLNYRIDNESSSVKSGAKVFCVSDEYASLDDFLSHRPKRAAAFRYIIPAKKYETYLWNYNRLDDRLKPAFLELMTKEFSDANARGDLDEKHFAPIEWTELHEVIFNPEHLAGKTLTVAPCNLNALEHKKTLRANNEISGLHLIAWRIKHLFDGKNR